MSKAFTGGVRSNFKGTFFVLVPSAALILIMLTGVLYGAAVYKEDINGDGKVNILDVVTLLLMGKANPADSRADFNGDSVWSTKDAIDLMTHIMQGNLTPLPPTGPKIALSADSLVFGDVTEGTGLADTLAILNLGGAALIVSGITTTDSSFTVNPDTATVEPGLTGHLTVTFQPKRLGQISATLSILSNDPAQPILPVRVSGSGIAPPAPQIVLSADSLSFGNVNVGSSKKLTFNIINQGNANLTVSAIASNDTVFSVATISSTLSPTQSIPIDVTFRPVAAGAKNAVLTIRSNDPARGTLTFAVSGTGVAVVVNKTYTVLMPGNVFSPNNLTIAVGDTVLWNNSDTKAHTATSGTNGVANGLWNSGNLNSGQTFKHVFTQKGSFPYFCLYHFAIGMTGTVTVN
ncbi:MAG: choice-of-anchor D domain-containing protein [Candidatus Glassbacteria bacterium]